MLTALEIKLMEVDPAQAIKRLEREQLIDLLVAVAERNPDALFEVVDSIATSKSKSTAPALPEQ